MNEDDDDGVPALMKFMIPRAPCYAQAIESVRTCCTAYPSEASQLTERTLVGREFAVRKRPFNEKPGDRVELRTTSLISFDSCSGSLLASSLILWRNVLRLSRSISGVKLIFPMAILTTPSLSLYNAPPTNCFNKPAGSLLIVPFFALGIRPLGPSIRGKPSLASFGMLIGCASNRSKLIFPSFTA